MRDSHVSLCFQQSSRDLMDRTPDLNQEILGIWCHLKSNGKRRSLSFMGNHWPKPLHAHVREFIYDENVWCQNTGKASPTNMQRCPQPAQDSQNLPHQHILKPLRSPTKQSITKESKVQSINKRKYLNIRCPEKLQLLGKNQPQQLLTTNNVCSNDAR